MTLFRTFLTLLMLSISMHTHAQERIRIALVIGNSDYQVSPLDNPINDARDIASTLKGLNFKVTLVEDANQQTMEEAIASFGEKLNKDTVGLFYYSGHAIQHNGSNYLIPIGAMSKVKKSSHLKYETVPSGLVLDELEQSQSKLNFVFLDACRNSPFRGFSRGIFPGLVKTESSQGTLISYSTAPGKVASDGVGKNSPYTKHLISQITKPNIQVELMLKEVKAAVFDETNEVQSPWYESSISGKFCFNGADNRCGRDREIIVVSSSIFLDSTGDIQTKRSEDGSVYEGEFKDEKRHGKGILIHENGERYEGDFKDGMPHGKGIYTWADGERYEGDFKDGMFHGKVISYTYANGERYEGSYMHDERHGKGIYTWPSGKRYEGDWKNGRLHGEGLRILADGSRYEGGFKDGLMHGEGILNYATGDKYEGGYKDGHFHGKGAFIFTDGERYKGELKDGEYHGKGTYTWADGDRYEGDWKGGKQHGKGIRIYTDGSRHEGNFKDGMSHGKGIFTSADGARYDGEYKNDNQHGKGIHISADGEHYEGDWKGNKMHGKGIYIYENGDQYDGEFKNDERHGEGIYTWANGTIDTMKSKNGIEIPKIVGIGVNERFGYLQ